MHQLSMNQLLILLHIKRGSYTVEMRRNVNEADLQFLEGSGLININGGQHLATAKGKRLADHVHNQACWTNTVVFGKEKE